MACIKTGFHAYLECYHEWLYGDAYKVGDTYIFRVCQRSDKPIRSVAHFNIMTYSNWFDNRRTSMDINSTMICASPAVTELGYEGVPVGTVQGE